MSMPPFANTFSFNCKHMEPYYFGGYFLMKTKPFSYFSIQEEIVQTCSNCINICAFDVSWCLSWTEGTDEVGKTELGLTDEKLGQIRKWTDKKFDEKTIKWGHALPDLETISTYKDLFFSDRDDITIYSMYLSKTDAEALIADFESEKIFQGQFGLRENLRKNIEEKDNLTEEFLGYDFIGVENHGSFHSFYCHNIRDELIDKFSLSLNENGLFDRIPNPDIVRKYLNDETTGLESVPWYIAKMKRLKNASS
jgi:hypothetical protein